MIVRLRFFALYRELVGKEESRIELPEGALVSDLLREVRRHEPRLRDLPEHVLAAVNLDYVPPDHPLRHGDEVALIPPVAGGSGSSPICVTDGPIDPQKLLQVVATPAAGALVLFVGTVRDVSQGRAVVYLQYEAYVEMAEKKLLEIAAGASRKWDLCGVAVEHRVGKLDPGEVAVAVAVSAAHRKEAFEAGRMIIDELKKEVPIWKKEGYADGEVWVDPGSCCHG